MVEETKIFEADHKVMLIIASPGRPGPIGNYLPSVFEDVKRAVLFANRYKFVVHQLIDKEATAHNINKFFAT